MGYEYSEFPHTNYFDTDLKEVINLYNELVSKYTGTLNTITSLETRLTEYEKEVEKRIDDKCRTTVEPLKVQVSNAISTMQSKVTAEIEYMHGNLTKMNNRMEDRLNEIESDIQRKHENSISDYNKWIENKFIALQNECKELIKTLEYSLYKQINDVTTVMSEYTDNLVGNIQQEIADLKLKSDSEKIWDTVYALFGFNCAEWYSFTEISCDEWNETDVTCEEWYVKGKHIFGYDKEKSKLISPFTGELELVEDIIKEISSAINPNALTALQYDSMKLTAEMFDKLRLSALEYDMKGVHNDFRNNKKSGTATLPSRRPPRLSD